MKNICPNCGKPRSQGAVGSLRSSIALQSHWGSVNANILDLLAFHQAFRWGAGWGDYNDLRKDIQSTWTSQDALLQALNAANVGGKNTYTIQDLAIPSDVISQWIGQNIKSAGGGQNPG